MSAVCAEEGSEEKINEEGTSTSNSLLGSDCLCLPLNMENTKEVIIVHNTCSPPSTQCVYTRGKNIKE